MTDFYHHRGVSSDKKEVHQAIQNTSKGLFPYAFCKIFPDFLSNDSEYCNVLHADGAGTKSSLAYIYWKETGDLSVWKGIAQDAIVMNTDDLLCVGICNNLLISSTIGRNKYKIPGEVIQAIIQGTEEFIQEMKKWNISIHLAGGETADIGDLVRTIVVDATVAARIPKNQIIHNEEIAPGQVLVGFASYGKSIYEKEYNSGIGSNGLTSARHDFLHPIYAHKYPESYDPEIPKHLIYIGKYQLTEIIPSFQMTAGKFLLSPTRTYLPLMQAIFQEMKDKIKGMVHCTGGGQTKCLHFVKNLHIVKNQLFEVPFLFEELQKTMNAPWDYMYKTFNMGHRLEIFTDEKSAENMIQIAKQFGIDAQIIGYTLDFQGKKLTLENPSLNFKHEIEM
jgi:phosphoribosylformylglycinamidine cyclo-ligase